MVMPKSAGKKIVSANYQDRESSLKWLVRDEGAPLESAIAYSSLVASGVVFTESGDEERGFGCRVVALCDAVTIGKKTTKKMRLQENFEPIIFTGVRFRREDGETLEKCHSLQLLPTGEMYALVAASAPAAVA